MRQRQSFGGGLGLLILALLLFMLFTSRGQGVSQDAHLSFPEFMVYLENGAIAGARLSPNREIPTGEVEIYMSTGERESFHVLDIREVEMALREAGISYSRKIISCR